MLAIRLQRTGRKGHSQFRMIVQEAHLSPKSGRVIELLGSYNPHSKELTIAKDKAELFLKNGAQPSETAVRLLKKEGIKLPSWVAEPKKQAGKLRNPEKLRKNRPAEPAAASEEAVPAEETPADTTAEDESTTPDEPVDAPGEPTPETAPEPEAPMTEEKPAAPVEESKE